MQQHQGGYPVSLMCRLLRVSRSGYYSWLNRSASQRAQANQDLLEKIVAIHRKSRETYGYPRVHAELRRQGIVCGRHRVARLMRCAGLRTRMQRLWERSARGRTFEHIEVDKLQRQFYAVAPNQRWVSDYTYIPTREGWLYLAVVMDLYSRMVVGWSMSDRRNTSLTVNAMKMALFRRGEVTGLLVHSDQGMEYRTAEYHQLLKDNGITVSMSRKGNCLDNAAMESFFHTLKTEHSHHYRYLTRTEARQSLFEYIEVFYNQQRRHSTLNYMTPIEFETYNAATSP
jgi:transposase InsO family protein